MLQMSSAVVDVKNAADDFVTARSILSHPMTKSSIIDRELNRHGMGRYQWLIWAVCGTGFFLNSMWTQAYGLVLSSIQREFGFSDKEYGKISAAILAGMAVGGFMWGALVDVVGRRVAFLGTSLITGVFGMFLGAQSSFNGLLVFMALAGVGIGGNFPIDATITAEYIPEDRHYLLAALSIFLPLGSVLSTLLAFWFVPNYSCSTELVSCHWHLPEPCCSRNANMGWRYLFFTIGSITLGVFIIRFFIFPFYESPKFLLSKGNDRGAVEVVQKIAAFNKRPCNLTLESLYEQCNEAPMAEETGFSKRAVSEFSRLKLLFGSKRMTRVTILVWITWIFDWWGLNIAATYMPTILQRKNSAIHVSLEQTYVDYMIVYTPGLVAAILSVLLVRTPMVGRKWTLVFASMVSGIALFLYSLVNSEASHVGFNMLQYFCQIVFDAALVGWTPEAFPAAVRGTATGLASFFGSLFAITGPMIAALLFSNTNGSNAVLYLAGSGLFVCTLALLCIPIKDMVAPP
ncbi:major facilitator superfamily domain-containing protein [Boletus edulis]|nr:major facilitator superfamily domain-containing protein [Boletus edulis]